MKKSLHIITTTIAKPLTNALLLLFLSLFVNAQNSTIDSLRLLIRNPSNDTTYINQLLDLSYKYILIDELDSCIYFAAIAQKKAEQLKFDKGNVTALRRIGAAHWYKGDKASAMTFLNKAIQLAQKTKNKHGEAAAKYLIGHIYARSGANDSGLIFLNQSLALREQIKDSLGVTDNLSAIGNIYEQRGQYSRAMGYYMRELKIKEQWNDPKSLAYVLDRIGGIHQYLNNYTQSLDYRIKAYKIVLQYGTETSISVIANNIGETYRYMKQYDSALAYYQKSYDLDKKNGDSHGMGIGLSNIGIIYEQQGKLTEAIEYQQKAIEILNLTQYQADVAYPMWALASAYNRSGMLNDAIIYANKALSVATEYELTDVIRDVYEVEYQILQKQGKYKEAFEMYQQYIAYRDTMQGNEMQKKIAEMQSQYEFEQQERQAEIKRSAEREQEKLQRNFLISGLVLLLVVIGAIAYSLRIKQRTNKELKEKNAQINQQTEEILRQKESIEEVHRHTKDSINYASRIQAAMLPSDELMNELLPQNFVLWMPRNVVSGDFYWIRNIEHQTIVAAADCTGHGVPGAFMSMLGISFLNDITLIDPLPSPSEILHGIREKIKTALRQSNRKRGSNDGMDITLCIIDKKTNILSFASAHQPFILIRQNELVEKFATNKVKALQGNNMNLYHFDGDAQPVGIYSKEEPFNNYSLQLQHGDCLYLFSDGFVDQLGGKEGTKYLSKPFKDLLLNICHYPMSEQKNILRQTITDWMGNSYDQLDDILVVGIKHEIV